MYHGTGCVPMDLSPQGVGVEPEVGWSEDFTCPLPAMDLSQRKGGNQDDKAHEHSRVNTVLGVSSKGQPRWEGWEGGSPEEVLLQGWGYGRTS